MRKKDSQERTPRQKHKKEAATTFTWRVEWVQPSAVEPLKQRSLELQAQYRMSLEPRKNHTTDYGPYSGPYKDLDNRIVG